MNVEIGTEVAQFPENKYINGIFVAEHEGTRTHKHTQLPHAGGIRKILWKDDLALFS